LLLVVVMVMVFAIGDIERRNDATRSRSLHRVPYYSSTTPV
jgi:hypothetical protein